MSGEAADYVKNLEAVVTRLQQENNSYLELAISQGKVLENMWPRAIRAERTLETIVGPLREGFHNVQEARGSISVVEQPDNMYYAVHLAVLRNACDYLDSELGSPEGQPEGSPKSNKSI